MLPLSHSLRMCRERRGDGKRDRFFFSKYDDMKFEEKIDQR